MEYFKYNDPLSSTVYMQASEKWPSFLKKKNNSFCNKTFLISSPLHPLNFLSYSTDWTSWIIEQGLETFFIESVYVRCQKKFGHNTQSCIDIAKKTYNFLFKIGWFDFFPEKFSMYTQWKTRVWEVHRCNIESALHKRKFEMTCNENEFNVREKTSVSVRLLWVVGDFSFAQKESKIQFMDY